MLDWISRAGVGGVSTLDEPPRFMSGAGGCLTDTRDVRGLPFYVLIDVWFPGCYEWDTFYDAFMAALQHVNTSIRSVSQVKRVGSPQEHLPSAGALRQLKLQRDFVWSTPYCHQFDRPTKCSQLHLHCDAYLPAASHWSKS